MLMAPKQKQPLGAPMTLGNMREMGVQRGARTTSIATSEALRRALSAWLRARPRVGARPPVTGARLLTDGADIHRRAIAEHPRSYGGVSGSDTPLLVELLRLQDTGAQRGWNAEPKRDEKYGFARWEPARLPYRAGPPDT